MLIRSASKDDLPVILEIMNYAILNTTAIYDYDPRSYQDILGWYEAKLLQKMPVFVGEEDGQVIGFSTYGIFRPKEAYKYCVEHSIYLKEEFHGRGFGKQILQHLVITAREQGIHTMIAGIDKDNKGSIEFHRKAGFVEIGTLKEVGFKFNRWLDLVFMQLML
jgi:L-amino acid N-acyltransferase